MRVLVVGVGSIGERHVRCFQATGRVTLAICEAQPGLARDVGARYNVADVYHDFEQAVRRDRCDAVVIATPAHLHISMAQLAAEQGKHLLIEKPLSTGLDGIEPLIATAQAADRVAMVAYVMRCHPALAGMREALMAGRCGTPRHAYVTAGQHFPTYRPAYRDIYYRARATGGGAIQDAMTHVLNAMEWLIGPIDQLVADAQHQQLPGVDVEDTVNLLARHGKVMAGYAFNQHQAPNETVITIVGDQGTLRFESHRFRWGWMNTPDTEWQYETSDGLERDTMFITQANRFLDAVQHGAPVTCSLEEARHTLRVNLAALDSSDNGAKWTLV